MRCQPHSSKGENKCDLCRKKIDTMFDGEIVETFYLADKKEITFHFHGVCMNRLEGYLNFRFGIDQPYPEWQAIRAKVVADSRKEAMKFLIDIRKRGGELPWSLFKKIANFVDKNIMDGEYA